MKNLGILYRFWAIHLMLTITMVSMTFLFYAVHQSDVGCLSVSAVWLVMNYVLVMSANLHDVCVYTACPVHTQLAFYKQCTKRRYRLEDRPWSVSYPAKLEEKGFRGVCKYCDGSFKGNLKPPGLFNLPPSPSIPYSQIQLRWFNVCIQPYSLLSVKSKG
jgi:hypothetical protein